MSLSYSHDIFVPILKVYNAREYLCHRNEKHVFSTDDPTRVCKLCVTQDDKQLGSTFRELLYRLHHPDICAAPRNIQIHNPRGTSIVIIAWTEEKADEIGRSTTRVHQFIADTTATLEMHGFQNLRHTKVGRFGQKFKWLDL